MARKNWETLSAPYRQRLERAGITQRGYEQGIDLRAARGHRPPPLVGSPEDLKLYNAVISGQGTEDDFKVLRTTFTRPSWLPASTPVDVAAAFSQLPPPSNWKSVQVFPRSDGQPWEVTVERKRGYAVTVEIPGGGYEGSGAKEFLNVLADIRDGRIKTGRIKSIFDYEVMGSV